MPDSFRRDTFEDYFINPRGKIWTKKRCKEVFAGRKMRKMAFWFIVIFLAALTVKDVIELVSEHLQNPRGTYSMHRWRNTARTPSSRTSTSASTRP